MEYVAEKKYNVLIVDDSSFMRRVISGIIKSNGEIGIIDTAADGIEALNMINDDIEKYDIVLLDVNMPKMNGLQVLNHIEKNKIKCKVIMVSVLVEEGAKETILALEAGAVDFVLKPTGIEGDTASDFEKRLIIAIDEVIHYSGKRKKAFTSETAVLHNKIETKSRDRLLNKLIVIASSTGGPKTLKDIIPKLPKEIDAPIVLIQHMPAGFTTSLADRLDELCDIHVKEAEDGEVLKKGNVYIAPGSRQLRIMKDLSGKNRFSVKDEGAVGGLNPCADITFKSIAKTGYDDITCVVLTGMGSDGKIGIEYLNGYKDTYVIAQEMSTCVVYGMPRAVINAKMADRILGLDDIAEEILNRVGVQEHGC